MNNQVKYLIVGIALAVVATGAFMAGEYSQVENVAEAGPTLCYQDKECVDWLNENFVSESQRVVEKAEMLAAIAAPHTEYAVVNHNHNYALPSHTHTTTTSSSGSSDFDLEVCHDFNCVNDSTRFNQGDTVYVKGDNPTSDRSLGVKIYDPDGQRIKTLNVSTVADSPFLFTYQIESDAEDGTYRIEVELSNDEDEINFIVD